MSKLFKMRKPIDFVAEGSRLTFLKQTLVGSNAKALYKCSCGSITEKSIASVKLGTTKSCGCYQKELLKTHGLTKHPLFKIWDGIKYRCHTESSALYRLYGAKGVVVCDEWRNDFMAFYNWAISNGWKKGLQLDKDIKAIFAGVEPLLYSPEYCSFVTNKENNQYRTNTKLIDYEGEKRTLQYLCEKHNINRCTVRDRLKIGMTLTESLNTPLKK